jgi:hypothetical protein
VKILLAIAHYTPDSTNVEPLIRCLVGWRGLATHGVQDFGGPCQATRAHDLDILVVDDGRHSAMEYVPAGLAERVSVESVPLRLPLACRAVLDEHRNGYNLIGYSEHDNWPTTASAFEQIYAHATIDPGSVLIPHRFERTTVPPYKVYIDGPNGHGEYGAMWLVTAAQWDHWRQQPHFLEYSTVFAGPLESGCAWSLLKTFRCVKTSVRGSLESEHAGERYARRSIARGVTWDQ